jgi:hypothetical protein
MEQQLHMTNGVIVLVAYVVLAIVGWVRYRQGAAPVPLTRALQGVAHLLLAVQVLLGLGLIARLGLWRLVHPYLALLTLLLLFLPLLVPGLRQNRALAAAVTPTAVAVMVLITYAAAEMKLAF